MHFCWLNMKEISIENGWRPKKFQSAHEYPICGAQGAQKKRILLLLPDESWTVANRPELGCAST